MKDALSTVLSNNLSTVHDMFKHQHKSLVFWEFYLGSASAAISPLRRTLNDLEPLPVGSASIYVDICCHTETTTLVKQVDAGEPVHNQIRHGF